MVADAVDDDAPPEVELVADVVSTVGSVKKRQSISFLLSVIQCM